MNEAKTRTRQPGDRRERLKYVLGQIRQARGEGEMDVDPGSDDSSDSEDEEVSWYLERPARQRLNTILVP